MSGPGVLAHRRGITCHPDSSSGHPIPTPRATLDPLPPCGIARHGATLGQPLIDVPSEVLIDFGAAEQCARPVFVAGSGALRKQVVYPLPLTAEEFGCLDDR